MFNNLSFPNSAGISPPRLPSAISRYFRLVRFPNCAGIPPSNSLYPMIIYSSDESCPSSPGISPVRLFPDRPRNFNICKLLKDFGADPSKKLPLRSSVSNEERFPRSSGRKPEKLLLDAFKVTSPEAPPRPNGKSPVKKFWLTSSLFSVVILTMDFDNDEENSLQHKLRELRLLSLCTSLDTMPLRFMWERSSFSTAPSELHKTPVQLQ